MNLLIKQRAQSLVARSLYVVGTPIGNLADISIRALLVLKNADVICAEDTRVTQRLLNEYEIRAKKLVSLRAHNEVSMAQQVCQWLSQGLIIAQVSDAGTPGICDPGGRLVHMVRESGFSVYSIPGPCALISALSILGIDADQFNFIGFLPSKKNEKLIALDKIVHTTGVVVCYEVPHRILNTLDEIIAKMPYRNLFLIRELTKTFETVLMGSAPTLKEMLLIDSNQQKGEMVMVFTAVSHAESESIPIHIAQLADELLPLLPIKKIATLLSNSDRFSKKALYTYLLEKKMP